MLKLNLVSYVISVETFTDCSSVHSGWIFWLDGLCFLEAVWGHHHLLTHLFTSANSCARGPDSLLPQNVTCLRSNIIGIIFHLCFLITLMHNFPYDRKISGSHMIQWLLANFIAVSLGVVRVEYFTITVPQMKFCVSVMSKKTTSQMF